MDDYITLAAIRKIFQEAGRTRVVLDGVNVAFARGEFVAVVGRSGSGKSTLLNLIAGIDTPTSGDVVIGGVNLTRLNDRARTLFRRDHVGFVFQFFNLIPTLSVIENVQMTAALAGLDARAGRARAATLLEEVGLADRAAAFPDKLSGGEQQRVAIARALAGDPELVLADEPTGNLDATTGAQVLGLLTRLTRERGKTLLMVTHSLEIAGQADRVFGMAQGKLQPVAPGVPTA
jgi:putative ABC transport system ATP-binding protein